MCNKVIYDELYELINCVELNDEDHDLIKELNEIKWTNKKALKEIRLLKRKINFFSKDIHSLYLKIEEEKKNKKFKSYQKKSLYCNELQ